jgi:hypothetical protein
MTKNNILRASFITKAFHGPKIGYYEWREKEVM